MSKIAWLFDRNHWLYSVSLLFLLGSDVCVMTIAFVTSSPLMAVAIGIVFLVCTAFLGFVWFGRPAQPALADRGPAGGPKRDTGY
jgi:phosphoglycerol transferase MdoB-like AlkP superfamily enzyme